MHAAFRRISCSPVSISSAPPLSGYFSAALVSAPPPFCLVHQGLVQCGPFSVPRPSSTLLLDFWILLRSSAAWRPVSLNLIRATGSRSAGDGFFFQSICSSRSTLKRNRFCSHRPIFHSTQHQDWHISSSTCWLDFSFCLPWICSLALA
jgi:hypothetical protein